MGHRTLTPSLSRRFKSFRFSRRPFYRRTGRYHRAHPVRRSASVHVVDGRTVISDAHRYLFVRIPKCANTTILTTLWLCENGYRAEDLERFSDDERRDLLRKQAMKTRFQRPSRLDHHQAAEVLEGYTKCIFVRNPFTRLASAYLYKFVRGKGDVGGRLGLGPAPSFGRFCDFLADGGLYVDIHWMPQAHLCPVPTHALDFVGRMEALGEDLDRLTQHLYGVAAPLLTRQHHATQAETHLRELYGTREIERVQHLYADDFEAFAYPDTPY